MFNSVIAKNIMHKLCIAVILVVALALGACSGSSGSSGGGANYALGTLPNGSTVYASQSTFTVSGNGSVSGSVGLSGGTPGESITLNFSVVESTTPTVTTIPSPCIIISGSNQTCSITFHPNGVAPGTYTVQVSYSYESASSSSAIAKVSPRASESGTLSNVITFIVSGNTPPTPVPGTLVISPLAQSQITESQTTTATVTLSNSQDVTTPVNVTITPLSPSNATTSPASCNLTTASNTCMVTLTAVAAGSATFSASATNYTTQTSAALTIVPATAAGDLVISAFNESQIYIGESATATVTLANSIGVTTPVAVNITNNSPGIASESHTPCNLTTASNTCTVTLSAIAAGSATFTADASNYTTQTSGTLTVYNIPSILLTTPGISSNPALMQDESFNIVATLSGSSPTAQTVSVSNYVSTLQANGLVVFSNQSSNTPNCVLQSPNAESCTFTIVPVWNLATPASYNAVFSNSGTLVLNPESVPFSVYQPAVYLPKTGESAVFGCTSTSGSCTNYTVPAGGDGNPAIGLNWPNPRFTPGTTSGGSACSGGEEVLVDNLTGLMWKQNANGGTPDWSTALSNADSDTTCGYTDWRLPNINELMSLVNDGYTAATSSTSTQVNWLQSQGFTSVQDFYWSSSSYAQDTGNAWYVNMFDGSTNPDVKTNTGNSSVLPVRGGQ